MVSRVTHGADVEQLDDVAIGLRRQGDKIGDVGGRGSALLEKLRALWDGPDFEEFSREWRSAHRTIDDAEEALRAYGKRLLVEAEEQRAAAFSPSGGPAYSGGEVRGSSSAFETSPATSGTGGQGSSSAAAFERTDQATEASFEQDGSAGEPSGEAFERSDSQGGAENAQEASAAAEQDPQGQQQGADGAVGQLAQLLGLQVGAALATAELISALIQELGQGGPLVVDELMQVAPDLSGAEMLTSSTETESGLAFLRSDGAAAPSTAEVMTAAELSSGASSTNEPGLAFERSGDETAAGSEAMMRSTDSTASPLTEATSFTPAPTGDGSYVSTDPSSPGQRSVVVDPGLASGVGLGSMTSFAEWLGLDELDLS